MAIALANLGEPESKAAAKKSTRTAIEAVARLLRNTVAVCKKCYVHPAVIDRYLDGSLIADHAFQTGAQALLQGRGSRRSRAAEIYAVGQQDLSYRSLLPRPAVRDYGEHVGEG